MNPKLITWRYKDSERFYWEINARVVEDCMASNPEDLTTWLCTITRSEAEDSWNLVDEFTIVGIGDETVDLTQIIGQWLSRVGHVCIGMTRYAIEIVA